MTAVLATAGLLVLFGLSASAVMAWCTRRRVRAAAPSAPPVFPPVSILKPVRGVDADFEANLESLYALDYPEFEIIVGSEDPGDPALDLARRVSARHPRIRTVFVGDPTAVGWNPKVNNLANIARRASHETLLISDSNIRVGPGYLKDLVARLAREDAGLVWSLFRAAGASGLGGHLEALQLHVFVAGGMSALAALGGRPGAIGKSMLLRKADLQAIGGFEYLSRFLAEDTVCAEELSARGRPVVVSGYLIDNVLGRRTVKDFAARHLRWARLRRHLSLPGYLGELLLNPVFIAVAAAAATRVEEAVVLAGAALLGMSAVDAAAERALGIRRPWWHYPFLELLLSLIKGVLWAVPLLSSTAVWRGHTLRIGARTAIEQEAEAVLAGSPRP